MDRTRWEHVLEPNRATGWQGDKWERRRIITFRYRWWHRREEIESASTCLEILQEETSENIACVLFPSCGGERESLFCLGKKKEENQIGSITPFTWLMSGKLVIVSVPTRRRYHVEGGSNKREWRHLGDRWQPPWLALARLVLLFSPGKKQNKTKKQKWK